MHLIVSMSDQPASRVHTWSLIAVLAVLALVPRDVRAQSNVTVAWDESQTTPVTGYSVSVDGVSTDYGLSPLGATGTCGCSVVLSITGGQHTIVITAYNFTGRADSAPLVIGPIANPGGPYSGQAGSALSVDGSGSRDASGTLATYAWNWGDGSSANSSSPTTSHTYTNTGTYTISLTVSDSSGASTPIATTATIAGGKPVSIACPVPSAMSSTGSSVAVTFAPTVTGGTPPVTTSCNPPSGSLFPVGTTPIACSATDVTGSTASCQSTVTVTGCSFTVASTSATATAAGGTSSVSVTTTGSCTWTAISGASWITITSGANGTGIGGVLYTVAANTSTSSRTGTLTVAGQAVTVNQSGASAPSTCTFGVSPTSQTIGSQGGSASTSVTTTSSCAWQAASNATSWITITSGANGSGNGAVAYSVSPNPFSSSRTGTLTVAGRPVSVTQSGTSLCPTTVSPLSQTVASAGGAESLSVAAAKKCAWTAASHVSWITIASGTSWTGNRTLKYSVAANSGAKRSGPMTVAGHTVTVTQDAAVVSGSTPAPPPPPLGLTTIGVSLDTSDSNYLVGSRVVTIAGGTVGSMSVWVGPTDPNNLLYQVAIYTDNNGSPGSLIARSAAGTLIANSWNTLPITATLQRGIAYWLMYNTNGSNQGVNDLASNTAAQGIGAFSQNPVAFGTWPAAFPPPYFSTDQYSMFVTFVH